MGSSKTVVVLEDTSRTKFCGLGFVLESRWPCPCARGAFCSQILYRFSWP